MRFPILALLTLALVGLCVPMTSAEDDLEAEIKDPALLPGDKAPAFTVEKFVKGDEFGEFENGKIYIVECWATWCGPCLQSIPHLTELQEKHPDIKVVGIAVSDPEIEGIESFVEEQGEKMAYTVAWEGKGSRTKTPEFSKNWMNAAGAQGIPHAFVVDGTGKIAWMGHPMAMDKALASILEGKWDVKKFREEHLVAARAEAFMGVLQNKLGELQQADDTDGMLALLDKYGDKSEQVKRFCTAVRVNILASNAKYSKQLIAMLTDITADPSKADPEALLRVCMTVLSDDDADGLTAKTSKWPKELKQAVKKATEDERLADVHPMIAKIVAAKGEFIIGERKKAAEILNELADSLTDPRQGRAKLQIKKMANELGGEDDSKKE